MRIISNLCSVVILQILSLTALYGQLPPPTVVGDKAYFSQNINVQAFRGKKFQLNVATKVEGKNNSSKSSIITVVRKHNNTIGYYNDLQQKLKGNINWENTNISGVIDTGATFLEIGGYCVGNGTFKFDRFQLSVETMPGHWKKIPIPNGDFENGSFESWLMGSNNKQVNFDGVKQTFDTEYPFAGKYALNIISNYTDYGNNDEAGNFALVNGIKLYYEIYGSGKPLLLLHGNGGSISGNKIRIADFKKKYRVIAVDNRAQGKSEDNGLELTYDLMTDDINGLLEQLNIDSTYIWGQSDGGIIGLILAMKHPDKVRKLATWGANIQANEQAFSPKVYESIIAASKNGKSEKERQLNTLMVKYPNMDFEDLKTIKAPVLIMAGDKDAINIEHTIKLTQNIPNSQLFIMPGASHFGAYEKPNLFNIVLSEFFEKTPKKN